MSIDNAEQRFGYQEVRVSIGTIRQHNTRANRHGGNSNAVGTESPVDLYSNSTIALDPDTGKLKWYYQHLPGDDWDEDYANERTLMRMTLSPDPKFVKWINPDIKRGEQRDVMVMFGEGGGMFVNDRATGQFLWGQPFPFDTPDFLIANIDGKTGKVFLNKNKLFTGPSDRRVICYWNTRSYWPPSYHPGVNAMFVPYVENCLDMTSGPQRSAARAARRHPSSGVRSQHLGRLMKINMTTGR
jgi:alcohol dehydrogenase (cytochrome c)